MLSVRQVSRPSLRRSASIRPSCSSAIIAARTLKSSRSSKAAIPISVLSSGDQLVSRCSKTLSSTEGWSVTTALTVSVRHRGLAVAQHEPICPVARPADSPDVPPYRVLSGGFAVKRPPGGTSCEWALSKRAHRCPSAPCTRPDASTFSQKPSVTNVAGAPRRVHSN